MAPGWLNQFGVEGPGWMYGVGVGAYLGYPDSRFGLQGGWVFRRIAYDKMPSADSSGPLIAISVRF